MDDGKKNEQPILRSSSINSEGKEKGNSFVMNKSEERKTEEKIDIPMEEVKYPQISVKRNIEVKENASEIHENAKIQEQNKYAPNGQTGTNETQNFLVLNKIRQIKEKEKELQKEQMLKNMEVNKTNSVRGNEKDAISQNNRDSEKEETHADDDAQYEIPVQRIRRTERNNSVKDTFFKNSRSGNSYEHHIDKAKHFFDVFNFHEFPIFLLEKRPHIGKKQKEKKYVVQFLDTFNDDFVKKNINNKVIFEPIDICKGVSYLSVDKNINVSCFGWKKNAFYYYKMMPLRKIYSKETIQKIMNKEPEPTTRKKMHVKKQHRDKIDNVSTDESTNAVSGTISMLKNFLKSDKEKERIKEKENNKERKINKEKDKFYSDLYLMPYEKNLKSSICLGTHIYSKERAVKKCFGLSIESNVFNGDLVNEENTNVQNNLENLYFDIPYNQNNVFFQPVPYMYKNKKIVDSYFSNSLKKLKWGKWSHLKDKEVYLHVKKDVCEFTKDVYYTTQNALTHFNSPKEFIMQTTQRIKDINIKMKQICERSFDIAQNLVMKLSKASKTS